MTTETEMTESNMKEFFQGVVDHVARLSTQAAQVEGLQRQVSDLYERVNTLEMSNAQLRDELNNANNRVIQAEAEVNATRSQLENERSAVYTLRETIVQRDDRVVEVETNLSAEREAHKVTLQERDYARNTMGDLEALVVELRNKLSSVTNDRDRLADECNEAKRQLSDLQTRLDRAQAILNPPPSVPLSVVS